MIRLGKRACLSQKSIPGLQAKACSLRDSRCNSVRKTRVIPPALKRYNVKALILLEYGGSFYGSACQRFLGAPKGKPPSIHAHDFGHTNGRHSDRDGHFQGSEGPGEEELGCHPAERSLAAATVEPVLANLQATGTDRGQREHRVDDQESASSRARRQSRPTG